MTAASKVRIYELSKQLDVPNKDLMTLLEEELGVTVKSHASAIDQDVADKLVALVKKKDQSPKAATAKSGSEAEKPAKTPAAKSSKAAKAPEPEPEPVPVKPKPIGILRPRAPRPEPTPEGGTPAAASTSTTPGASSPVSQASTSSTPSSAPQSSVTAPPATATASVVSKPVVEAEKPVLKTPLPASGTARPGETRIPPREPMAASQVQQRPQQRVETPSRPMPPRDQAVQRPASGSPQRDTTPVRDAHSGSKEGVAKKPTTEHTKPEPIKSQPPEKPLPVKKVQPQPEPEPEPQDLPPVKIEAPLTVRELAQKINKRETELIKHLFMQGVMITLNQTLPVDDAVKLAIDLGVPAEGPDKNVKLDDSAPELKVSEAKGKHLTKRAPVVSIMGHVDHGKTSLLDAIRQTRHRIVDSEAGGITQSIGAYTVNAGDQEIVFLDTPGHEAFTAMRMRGAQSTDIAILVVAADDGVMPQTIEAINHAKAANIPIIVAVNKIDREDADPDKVLLQLSEHGLNAEKWGGDTITVEVSALKKQGLETLLEMIALVSELQELKADKTLPAEGVVIEAQRDKGKGPVATVLVQSGTLRISDNIRIGPVAGRVRALINDHGERIQEAGPSTPVEVLGLSEVPHAGELFEVIHDQAKFKQRLAQAQLEEREQRFAKKAAPGLMSERETQDFYCIVKADTQGSLEAVTASLLQMATEEVSVHILHAATGDISETDVMLASANDAVIIAFNVKSEATAQRMIVDQKARVRFYDVIYHITEDVEKMMLGLLAPEQEEVQIGTAEVRQLFTAGKKTIAGCYITSGKVVRNGIAKVMRKGREVFMGNLDQLKRFREDAKEVAAGYECGISFDKFNDLQEGDIIELYALKEVERTSLTT